MLDDLGTVKGVLSSSDECLVRVKSQREKC